MEPLNPKVEGVCDACGGKLTIRDDDKKDVSISIFIFIGYWIKNERIWRKDTSTIR